MTCCCRHAGQSKLRSAARLLTRLAVAHSYCKQYALAQQYYLSGRALYECIGDVQQVRQLQADAQKMQLLLADEQSPKPDCQHAAMTA